MVVQTSQGLASRLGYRLGRVVLFFLMDDNVVLRWVKRAVLVSLIYAFFAHFGRGIVSALMAPLILLFIVLAMVKLGGSKFSSSSINYDSNKNVYDSQLFGDKSLLDSSEEDPHSLENVNNPLFLHETHFNWNKDSDYNSDR
ncbi:hypothetical protein AWM79_12100 [Pseudomonas agarici]|uniref:Uncharacterized protein n=1 Tax=Pseudomonas agarici TaxID=46677 RepID=A0A0X1T1W6_PSEAA|nr:hypothetical protein [Pseudomonas agarici]AMB86001.1 hypothetical protein AWM79_12100 [Pseudomonas agarici]